MSVSKYYKMNEEYLLSKAEKEAVKTKRVAAYCRVSTDSDDQASSLENQQEFFKKEINNNPNWVLYDIFTDEGKSGTNTKNRKAFNRMIECARNGEIDLIITKDISRFARNVMDCLTFTQELYDLGVEVRFLTQNISTFDSAYKIIFLILSAFAQEESRNTSMRVRFGQGQRMEEGVTFGRSLLGYDVKDGKITVNEEEAKIVRRIFEKALEGKGSHVIARELMEEGFFPKESKRWSSATVLRVLQNEKYCGDLVQGKTYTPDYLTHKRAVNHGESKFYIIENHHEPIISKEVFDKVNEMLNERSKSQRGKSKYSNRYVFSGKIKCSACGSSYVSRIRERKDDSPYKDWRCSEAVNHGKPKIDQSGNQVGCSLNAVRDEDAAHLMYLTLKSLKANEKKIKSSVLKTVKSVIAETSEESTLKQLKAELEKQSEKGNKLLDIYMSNTITKEEYLNRKSEIDLTVSRINEEIQRINSREKIRQSQDKLMSDIENAIDEILNGVEKEDEFYREILDKMVVIDKDTMDVYLKFVPEKWRYVLANAAKDKYDVVFSDTELPPI
ncbi:MAG: recombinase family protein [Bacteroides sp.]|nr:recombinase family protein [Bacteroides sp.]